MLCSLAGLMVSVCDFGEGLGVEGGRDGGGLTYEAVEVRLDMVVFESLGCEAGTFEVCEDAGGGEKNAHEGGELEHCDR